MWTSLNDGFVLIHVDTCPRMGSFLIAEHHNILMQLFYHVFYIVNNKFCVLNKKVGIAAWIWIVIYFHHFWEKILNMNLMKLIVTIVNI